MTLEFRSVHNGWAYILWSEPGTNKLSALKELKKIEAEIKASGMKGWIAESEFQYTPMHRILEKLGARIYGQDSESYYFMKVVV